MHPKIGIYRVKLTYPKNEAYPHQKQTYPTKTNLLETYINKLNHGINNPKLT